MHVHPGRWLPAATAAIVSLFLGACAIPGGGSAGAGIVLDGDVGEWSGDAAAWADAEYLYFRFKVDPIAMGGPPEAIQASPRTVILAVDADASGATGFVRDLDGLRGFGADLEVHFSPREKGRGAAVFALSPDGSRRSIATVESRLTVAPTYASEWYEGRITRSVLADLPGLDAASRRNAVTALMLNADGKPDAWADPYAFEVPAPAEVARVEALVPARAREAVRVVSWNVERSSPLTNPQPFARVLSLLEADVVLVQEWDEGSAVDLAGWFTAYLPAGPVWSAHKLPSGVGVVSRFPLTPVELPEIRVDGGGRADGSRDHVSRVAAAVVDTPSGPVAFASVHLKCCGSASGREESTRQAEARLINARLGEAWGGTGVRVISGDLNLVGTRRPLDLLRAGLDADGSDLDVVQPGVLGCRTMTTWRKWDSEFSPSRLDFVLHSGARSSVVRSFVLDTTILSDASLARLGVSRVDSDASDHDPVVVDLIVR